MEYSNGHKGLAAGAMQHLSFMPSKKSQ